jgi:hypothetical protein
MRLFFTFVICGCLGACAQPSIPEGDVFTLYGDRHLLSDNDLEAALNVVREDMIYRYGAQVPITRVRLIDRNHIKAGYWHGTSIYAEIERVAGHWTLTRYKKGVASRSRFVDQSVVTRA